MTIETIIRAWKDEDYRQSLSEQERAQLPANPSGVIELRDAELNQASGALPPKTTNWACSLPTAVCKYLTC